MQPSSESREEPLSEIGRTLRHAQATRRTESDSWLNGYQDDVAYLLAEIERLRRIEEAGRVTVDEFNADNPFVGYSIEALGLALATEPSDA